MTNNKITQFIKWALVYSFTFLSFIGVLLFTFINQNNKMATITVKGALESEASNENKQVRFDVGTIEKKNVAPFSCAGNKTYVLYGKITNSLDRVVGLDAQDARYILYFENSQYELEPFKDPCIVYQSKTKYLLPNTSTKASMAIVNNAESASNIQFTDQIQANSIYIIINTNQNTDLKIKERLQAQNAKAKTPSYIDYSGTNYVFVEPIQNIDNTAKIAAIWSLIPLLLCPIAIIIADKVFPKRRRKETS